MLSGYRVFSRRFVKSFPVLSGGFEIETELTVHALELELPVGEVRTPYYSRPEGSSSKLNTWRDGFRILWTILRLYRAERPLALFTGIGVSFAVIVDRPRHPGRWSPTCETGLVPRLPTAILATGLMLLAVSVGVRRAHPRHRDARAARAEAARLSGAARAGRRAAASA